MRAALTLGLAALAFASSSSAFAASGTLDQVSLNLGGITQVLAGMLTLGLLYIVKAERHRVLKLGAPRRHHEARGLFDD